MLSYSRVETFKQCPHKYKLKYVDGIKIDNDDYEPTDPLRLGTALHKGIEVNSQLAIEEYFKSYPIISDKHIDEQIKLEYWIEEIKKIIPQKGWCEVEVQADNFIGFIDYLTPCGDKKLILWDWKYSNHPEKYAGSPQLSIYKYFFEKQHPDIEIVGMYFVVAPKCNLRQKKTESVEMLRQRIMQDLKSKSLEVVKIEYDESKVREFLENGNLAETCVDYIKKPSRLCDWCEYQELCEKGGNEMTLPSIERRTLTEKQFKKLWIYGLPFSGKTYLANQFDTPLMLNTDGNISQVDAPVQRIADEVVENGRITERKFAWEVFLETIEELEKGSDFKTIIVDLVEDVYDACRIKVCADRGWSHESDDSFRAYDIVRNEFLRVMRRLVNLPYNIILISHEDNTKDIARKSGDKITTIKPNIPEKLALKLAGMVDIVCRVVNDDGERIISLKSSEVEFGGGRLALDTNEIACSYEAIDNLYGGGAKTSVRETSTNETSANETSTNEVNVDESRKGRI